MRWLWALLVSSLAMAGLIFIEQAPKWKEDDKVLIPLLGGCGISLVLALPGYAFADFLQRKLNFPIWTQLLINALMWFVVFSGFFLCDSKTSGISSIGVVLRATLQVWAGTLPFGIPWVILTYREERRSSLPTVYWE